MTQRKGTAIKQSAVSEVMSSLSELPDRGKDPGTAISLGKVFRTKEYFAEIKGALKKGYTFENLAAIFAERCDVNISARQMKYHYTREKNRRAKNNAGGKPKQPDTSKGSAQSGNSARTDAIDETGDAGSVANAAAIHVPKRAFVTADGATCPAETLAFPFEKRQ
jgi:hypothetical protein